MARKVTVQMIDDFDGASVAEETVRFGLDGVDYEIDLSVLNAGKLREVFELWTGHGRKTSRGLKAKRSGARPLADREQTAAIRRWARANGHDVSSRGRIHSAVVEAYEKATA
ncbi:histone-like nucleoid-structuring protein Lsr2 [Nocardia stercoris]|uniref:Lsr2 family protein n=1 Tax=Nocardia stercoris TaxID=2483361 RepID=A0A3M2KSF5_9NOCA|nr:Lsr2 family protein [Nocardia stercoris]RMI28419.1 Lsr2 family protein [Nocardia stercoris]